MDYHTLNALRQRHPAWRLLVAEHAPFAISFFYHAFTKPSRRTLAQSELSGLLDDYLYGLRAQLGAEVFPRTANEYLNDWAENAKGWLRKFYVEESDEPHFDLTSPVEKLIEWLQGLVQKKQFVGTESRLKTIFDLLHQVERGTETDPAVRIAELEQRRNEIDAEIARIRGGELDLMDATQLKERYFQVDQTARSLLADFREVEQNFRDLDRLVRERIALWEGGKGEMLESIFGEHDVIADSDQGRSFRAFWDFLMSPSRQEELSKLLERMLSLDAIAETSPDRRLLRVHYDWLEAGDAAQRTVARLSEQLRKYLDDQALLENRRIMTIIRDVEHLALELRGREPEGSIVELNETAPSVNLVMDRPLFKPPFKPHIVQQVIEQGGDAVDASALFDQVYVDKTELSARIRKALQTRSQITLATLLQEHPLMLGLAELVAYLSIAAESDKSFIDDTHMQTVMWSDSMGNERQASMPVVIFNR